MLRLKELPGVPSTLSPTRCGTRISQGGGSRCEGKGEPAAEICQAVETHLTTWMDTARPTAPDLMEEWMFNGDILAWNAVLKPAASFCFQPREVFFSSFKWNKAKFLTCLTRFKNESTYESQHSLSVSVYSKQDHVTLTVTCGFEKQNWTMHVNMSRKTAKVQ